MTEAAPVSVDEEPATSRGIITFPPSTAARIGWGLLIAQIVTVGVVFFVGSTVPAMPAIFAHIASGAEGEPVLSSFTVWLTVTIGMALGLLVAWAWLRREKRVGEAWDLRPPAIGWKHTFGWAALGTFAIFLIFGAGGALLEAFGLEAPDPSFVLDLVTESPQLFALWIVGVAWLAAGAGEELLYRGFLMDRLARVSGLQGRAWLVIVIQAILFGLPHAYQGWGGMLVTGTVGLFLGWLRLRMNGNLWACIIAHAAVDTLAMSLAYSEKLGWIST